MGNGQPFCLCPALAPERGSRVSAAPVSLGAHGPAGGCRTVATSCRLAQRVWRESQSYSLCSSLRAGGPASATLASPPAAASDVDESLLCGMECSPALAARATLTSSL